MTNKFVEATIALFKSVPYIASEAKPLDEEKLIKNGIVIAPQAKSAYPAVADMADYIIKTHGFDVFKANRGLHKSFDKVKNADPMQLYIEQMLHYTSVFFQHPLAEDTDPAEVNPEYVYIPAEELSLPEGAESVRVAVINALTDKEIVMRAKSMLSGMALTQDTQNHLMAIVRHFKDQFALEDVRNKEFRVRMMDELGIMPKRAGELLRFIVFRKTGLPMIVHSKRSVAAVAANTKGYNSAPVLKAFVEQNGVEAIAREFNRHRNFWVILKKDSAEVATIINKAKRLAEALNVPAKIGVLDRIGDKSVTLEEVQKELPRVTLWKKVSLANSLLRRSGNPSAELYTVRTGRSYSKKNEGEKAVFMTPSRLAIMNAVIDSIVAEVRPNVEGKTVKLPDGMDYAFPTSEKQFVGNIPFYSTLDVTDGAAIVGIHWVNVKGKNGHKERVDLDLHYTSSKNHCGWNEPFTSEARKTVYHSGDLTDAPAPHGATEAVYVSDLVKDDFAALTVNDYTGNSVPVPYTLFYGTADPEKLGREYLVSSHEFCAHINGLEAANSSTVIGFVESTENAKKVHFFNSALGTGIVDSYDENKAAALEAVKSILATRLSLKDVLARAGAKFEKDDEEAEWDIDLSFEALTRDSWAFLSAKAEEKAKVAVSL